MRRAFTLIELLVVVAVIAVLAALLFPAFAKARERSRQVACGSNLKQIYVAMRAFMDDWDDKYPSAICWEGDIGPIGPDLPEVLESYVKDSGIWKCPSDTGEVFFTDGRGYRGPTRPFWDIGHTSYDWLGLASPLGTLAGRTSRYVRKPSHMPLVLEPRPWHGSYRHGEDWFYSLALYNVVYCDGHLATRNHREWSYTDMREGMKR